MQTHPQTPIQQFNEYKWLINKTYCMQNECVYCRQNTQPFKLVSEQLLQIRIFIKNNFEDNDGQYKLDNQTLNQLFDINPKTLPKPVIFWHYLNIIKKVFKSDTLISNQEFCPFITIEQLKAYVIELGSNTTDIAEQNIEKIFPLYKVISTNLQYEVNNGNVEFDKGSKKNITYYCYQLNSEQVEALKGVLQTIILHFHQVDALISKKNLQDIKKAQLQVQFLKYQEEAILKAAKEEANKEKLLNKALENQRRYEAILKENNKYQKAVEEEKNRQKKQQEEAKLQDKARRQEAKKEARLKAAKEEARLKAAKEEARLKAAKEEEKGEEKVKKYITIEEFIDYVTSYTGNGAKLYAFVNWFKLYSIFALYYGLETQKDLERFTRDHYKSIEICDTDSNKRKYGPIAENYIKQKKDFESEESKVEIKANIEEFVPYIWILHKTTIHLWNKPSWVYPSINRVQYLLQYDKFNLELDCINTFEDFFIFLGLNIPRGKPGFGCDLYTPNYNNVDDDRTSRFQVLKDFKTTGILSDQVINYINIYRELVVDLVCHKFGIDPISKVQHTYTETEPCTPIYSVNQNIVQKTQSAHCVIRSILLENQRKVRRISKREDINLKMLFQFQA